MKYFKIDFVNKVIQLLLSFLFIMNMAASLYMPFFAIYVQKFIFGATLATIGMTVALYSITKSVFQIPIAKRLDRTPGETDDFKALLLGAIIGIIYSFGFIFITQIWQLYVLEVLAGLGDACMMAALYAIFSHHLDKKSEGFEWSLFSVGGLTLAMAVGSLIGGFMVDRYGFKMIFMTAGIMNMFGVILLFTLSPKIKAMRNKKVVLDLEEAEGLAKK